MFAELSMQNELLKEEGGTVRHVLHRLRWQIDQRVRRRQLLV